MDGAPGFVGKGEESQTRKGLPTQIGKRTQGKPQGDFEASKQIYPMASENTARLINALRVTLNDVTASSHLRADDPILLRLKSILLHRIAELRIAELEAETPSVELTAQK